MGERRYTARALGLTMGVDDGPVRAIDCAIPPAEAFGGVLRLVSRRPLSWRPVLREPRSMRCQALPGALGPA